jgi:hypothetical protein
MVTFWCSWCGNTARRATRDETVRCGRCVDEAVRLFRYWPWTVMIPLGPGESPPTPHAAKRRFEFTDVKTHRVAGRTEVAGSFKLRPVPL